MSDNQSSIFEGQQSDQPENYLNQMVGDGKKYSSEEELAKGNFVLPAIARIRCEQLKHMMDRGDVFTLVDTRSSNNYKRDHLPGAINIPEDDPSLTKEWVNDQLAVLPEGIPTIFYCD